MIKTVAIIASLDTKGNEVEYARGLIYKLGHKALVIDTSVRFEPIISRDVSREEVLSAAGISWETILASDKGKRIELMTGAITVKLAAIYDEGRFDAVFSMGGAQNTMMATRAMKALPVGVPKLMLTTIASGRRAFEPLVGTKDMVIMHSVADIMGENFITRNVIGNAVAAIVGMAAWGSGQIRKRESIVVGASMLGITGDGVAQAAQILTEKGCEVVTFHANGVGGRSLEEMISQGMINAVLDMTLHEITSEILGGYCAGSNNRLEAAASAGIPQVLVPGAIDMIDYGTDPDGKPAREVACRDKRYFHNSSIVHAKVTREEIIQAAELVATRVNKSIGPVTVLLPRQGFCQNGAPGAPLHDPSVDYAFIDTLKAKLAPKIKVVEADYNINDSAFALLAANSLLEYLPLNR